MSKYYFVNERIRVPEVRVIGDDGSQIGVLKTPEAIGRARESGLDLVLIAPNSKPPVAKITDFGKYKYKEAKHDKELRKSQRVGVLKEIKLSVKIGEHDLNVRIRQTREFLEKGNKVKASVYFKGREVTHAELGRAVLQKLIDQVADLGMPEKDAVREGKSLLVIIAPRSVKHG